MTSLCIPFPHCFFIGEILLHWENRWFVLKNILWSRNDFSVLNRRTDILSDEWREKLQTLISSVFQLKSSWLKFLRRMIDVLQFTSTVRTETISGSFKASKIEVFPLHLQNRSFSWSRFAYIMKSVAIAFNFAAFSSHDCLTANHEGNYLWLSCDPLPPKFYMPIHISSRVQRNEKKAWIILDRPRIKLSNQPP